MVQTGHAMVQGEAVATLRETLQKYLVETFGTVEVDRENDFVVRNESSVTFIRPAQWIDDQTLVVVWSIINVGVRIDDELTKFLATENAKVLFGRFQLDEEHQAVSFSHTLLGDFLNRKELEVAVAAVASTANQYDDIIMARFGGRRFTDPATT